MEIPVLLLLIKFKLYYKFQSGNSHVTIKANIIPSYLYFIFIFIKSINIILLLLYLFNKLNANIIINMCLFLFYFYFIPPKTSLTF